MSLPSVTTKYWTLPFLFGVDSKRLEYKEKTALIILNQPTEEGLLKSLWEASSWHACADGGANRLYDICGYEERRSKFLPDLIKGDFDSIRPDVKLYYEKKLSIHTGVDVVQDNDQNSTDLQKCLSSLVELEGKRNEQYTVVVLGGLSGRLDQTIHTLSLFHKLRSCRDRIYAVTDENVGWVLDKGEHTIEVDMKVLGPTCGLLPVGVEEATLSTSGLRWNLSDTVSSFDGLVSTSNHVVDSRVWIKTTKPLWWCIELRHQK